MAGDSTKRKNKYAMGKGKKSLLNGHHETNGNGVGLEGRKGDKGEADGARLCTRIVFTILLLAFSLTTALFVCDYKQGQLAKFTSDLPPVVQDLLGNVDVVVGSLSENTRMIVVEGLTKVEELSKKIPLGEDATLADVIFNTREKEAAAAKAAADKLAAEKAAKEKAAAEKAAAEEAARIAAAQEAARIAAEEAAAAEAARIAAEEAEAARIAAEEAAAAEAARIAAEELAAAEAVRIAAEKVEAARIAAEEAAAAEAEKAAAAEVTRIAKEEAAAAEAVRIASIKASVAPAVEEAAAAEAAQVIAEAGRIAAEEATVKADRNVAEEVGLPEAVKIDNESTKKTVEKVAENNAANEKVTAGKRVTAGKVEGENLAKAEAKDTEKLRDQVRMETTISHNEENFKHKRPETPQKEEPKK